MNATAATVTITPDAQSRVAELGLRAEMEQILEHVRRSVRGLVALEVVLAPRPEEGGDPGLTIVASTTEPWTGDDQTESDLAGWLVDTFPAAVCEQVAILVSYRSRHAG